MDEENNEFDENMSNIIVLNDEDSVVKLAPTGKTVKVIAPPERKYSAWLGGAILSSMKNFKGEDVDRLHPGTEGIVFLDGKICKMLENDIFCFFIKSNA